MKHILSSSIRRMYMKRSARPSYEELQAHFEAVRITVRHKEGLPDYQVK